MKHIETTQRSVVCSEFVSVTEGDSVTLSVSLTESQREDRISWKFRSQEINAAEIIIVETEDKGKNVTLHEDRVEGRFRDRLKLNKHTGSLTITNTNITHTGLYKVNTIRTNTQLKTINLTVYAHLPIPVITRVSPQKSSSSSICSLVCSVLNVRDVSLSWYKGNSLLSSISVSNIKTTASLPLEVEYQDNNTYRCVLNNPITNQTQHLNITHLCQTCSADFICCCGFTEAVIRLVVSALVALAAVALLVCDVKTSRKEQKRMRSKTQIND
nr:SLAM family member 6-like [Misgurnus anguillicaudatus]